MSGRKFLVAMPHGPARRYADVGAVLTHAAEHARNRLLHSCEAISWVASLALQWRKPYVPVFSLEGAEVQDATASGGEQAAHVLVGQLLIDGKAPWALARGTELKVAWLARFMVTSAVPVTFNTADSAAEKSGLKEAFLSACARAWRDATAGQRDLTPIYESFLRDADRAFRSAEFAKADRQVLATTKGDERASDERLVEKIILRAFRVHGVTAREANRIFPMNAKRAT